MKYSLILVLPALLFSCSTATRINRSVREMETRHQGFTGFMVYNPESKKTIFQHQADRYFTPASNTKILTFFAGLQLLNDTVPGLRYGVRGDSLIIVGTGDPSFLNERVGARSETYDFLRQHPLDLYLAYPPSRFRHFGPGWAWDDYGNSYSPERSPFPIYGNVVKVRKAEGARTLELKQQSFRRFVWLGDSTVDSPRMVRDHASNNLWYLPSPAPDESEWEIPFRALPSLVATMLSDTLGRTVRLLPEAPLVAYKTHYSAPADSLYRVMMQDSDNFIAEQMLIMISSLLGDTLDSRGAIEYVMKNFLFDLPDRITWVDGSGLSRYNQFTPRSIVRLWEKISILVPDRDRLFSLLAAGGKSGTLESGYKPVDGGAPYVFGKTGSLRNNHCLSGYLIAKSGKTYIFSLMTSNYSISPSELRTSMEKLLRSVYEKY